MSIGIKIKWYLLKPLDVLPTGAPPKGKMGFANKENKPETLARWRVMAAPTIGERKDGQEYPALFQVGQTVLLITRITQEDFDSYQLLPGFAGEEKVAICSEEQILGVAEE